VAAKSAKKLAAKLAAIREVGSAAKSLAKWSVKLAVKSVGLGHEVCWPQS